MTTIQSSTKAPRQPNKLAGEGGPLHAYVNGGTLFLMTGGRYIRASRWQAVSALAEIDGSPFPSSQERARQIRAALKETVQ